ncbi:MAG: P-loop NTPase [Candidatus Limnocylindrales bacterium]
MDPRPAVVARRLARVGRILAVTGGKGGIGKSSVSVGLALGLAGEGARVGLLDLDLTGPSDHVILGVERPTLTEDAGLVPMLAAGLRFLSVAAIVGERAAPLRGEDISNAVLELLAVTNWGRLDALVVDMPPGFGDALLDVVRLLPRAEYVVVATPSPLVLETVGKALELLRRLDLPVVGLVENMRRDDEPSVMGRLPVGGLPLLGSVGYDALYETALGDLGRLLATRFMREMAGVAHSVAAGPRGAPGMRVPPGR